MTAWKRTVSDRIRAGDFATLSGRAKAVLMVLIDYADANGLAYPGDDTIAAQAGVAARKVREAKLELERLGWIEREGRGSPRVTLCQTPTGGRLDTPRTPTGGRSTPGGGRSTPTGGRIPPTGGRSLKEELPNGTSQSKYGADAGDDGPPADVLAALGAWADTGRVTPDARIRIAWVIADDFDRRGVVALRSGGELNAAGFTLAAVAEANRSRMLLATTRQGQSLMASMLQRCRDEGCRPGEYRTTQDDRREAKRAGEFTGSKMRVV